MAMDLGGAKGGVKSDINVTPLVDVMLVLLIIMMLVAPLLQQGITVTLPKAINSADKPETRGQTTIAISVDKHVYLNAKEVPNPNENLGVAVKELLEEKKKEEKGVFSKADQGVDYGVGMSTRDQLRAAGIEDMGLITLKPQAKAAGGQQYGRLDSVKHTSARTRFSKPRSRTPVPI